MLGRLASVVLFFIGLNAVAQNVEDSMPTSIEPKAIIKKYFKLNPPQDQSDSVFIDSYKYLNQFVNSEANQLLFENIQQLVSANMPENELAKLYGFRAKVDSLNMLRKAMLTSYWEQKRLQSIADTSEVNFGDSLFFETIEAVTTEDTINIDSILKVLGPYNDTLLMAIDLSIKEFKNNEYLQWIRNFRNDTLSINLININGDSLRLRLYDSNPRLIKFDLTDYWGTNIPAVIRNIEKRSFKILIDDAPELAYETDEKAKNAIGQLRHVSNKRSLTIQTIPVNIERPIWLKGGNSTINISQVGMHQWAKGGDPAISLLAGLELFAKYRKNHISWENTAKFRYGVIRQGRYTDTAVHFRSSEDRIELASKYGYKVFGRTYITLEGDFKSQFTPTYKWNGNNKSDEIVSKFMNPGYLTFSFGLDYKPNETTTFFVAPVSSKMTFVLDDLESVKKQFGVDPDANGRYELGARIKISNQFKIWDDIEIKNSLELFSGYLNHPQNVDINWGLNITLPVNNFIKATITSTYIYDDDTGVPKYKINEDTGLEEEYTGKGGQFQELIAVGFAVKF